MVGKKAVDKVKHDQQMAARRTIMEELFNDYYNDRRNIYKMNFIRGLFFGLGSVLGATVIVAIILWILSFFVDLPFIGEAAQQAKDSLDRGN